MLFIYLSITYNCFFPDGSRPKPKKQRSIQRHKTGSSVLQAKFPSILSFIHAFISREVHAYINTLSLQRV